MVTNLRLWDRLRTLGDDFNRRDFQLVTAFADALSVHESVRHPGAVVSGYTIPAEDVIQLLNDDSMGSMVRTLGRQYRVDNPKEVLARAINMIGINVPGQTLPHYSDSLKSTGRSVMNISEHAMRRVVHQSVFGEEFAPLDPDVSQPEGMYAFAVKIQFSTPETETPRTETLSIRAGSPEEAKGMAARIAREKNYINFSVVGIEVVKYTGPGAPGLVPHTAPLNVQPGALAGQVHPSDVSPALPDTGVVTPRTGMTGQNIVG
jgi:hypothetical protein